MRPRGWYITVVDCERNKEGAMRQTPTTERRLIDELSSSSAQASRLMSAPRVITIALTTTTGTTRLRTDGQKNAATTTFVIHCQQLGRRRRR